VHHALWTKLHAEDTTLAPELAEKQIEPLQYQVNHSLRTSISETATMSTYLHFRVIDGGIPLTCALHYFVPGINLTPSEREILAPLEALASQHICLVNDIFSYAREVADFRDVLRAGYQRCGGRDAPR
jgi:Terpene synthase family 2, C-terminal metal binding